MAKFRSIKNSLIAGQISPNAFGRTDLPQYAHACKTLRNTIPMLSGGAYRRPGTLFDSSWSEANYSAPRIIPFVVSKSESYAVLLMRQYIVADAVAGIVQVCRASDTCNISSPAAMSGHHPWIDVNDLYYREYEDVQYAQSVDVMTLVHPSYKPQRLTRIATDDFTVTAFDAGLTGASLRDAWPYRAKNTTAITLSINTATVGVGRTVTASSAFFNAGHVGALFKLDSDAAGTIGCFKVTGYTDSTHVTVEVIVAMDSTAASLIWWESAWSDYRGWPRTVAFYANRICYGGNATDRDSIWLSQSNNYNVMSGQAIADPLSSPTGTDPFTYQLSSQQLNLIQWMSVDKNLVAGTLGEEHIIQPISETDGVKCSNMKSSAESHYGSSFHPSVRIGEELVFCTPADSELKSLIFSDLQQSYVAEPIQLFFDEYPKPEFTGNARKYRSFSWDESRKTLWCVDTAGHLFGMTRDRRLQVTSWHEHEFGGFDSSLISVTDDFTDKYGSLCAGSVVSAAVVPNPVIGANDIWVCVRRKVNGTYSFHVERFMGFGLSANSAYNTYLGLSGNYFADSCVRNLNAIYLGIPETHTHGVSPGAFDHLEGETLTGTANSFIGIAPETGEQGIFQLRDAVVTAGVVTMGTPYPPSYDTVSYEVVYGLPFDSVVVPVRLEAGSQIGSAQGAIKRIDKLTLRFSKTMAAKAGASSDLVETLIFREGSTPMGSSPELFTGDKTIDPECDYDRDGYVYILQDKPLPFCLVSIVAEGMTYD